VKPVTETVETCIRRSSRLLQLQLEMRPVDAATDCGQRRLAVYNCDAEPIAIIVTALSLDRHMVGLRCQSFAD